MTTPAAIPTPGTGAGRPPGLAAAVARYTLARLALLAAITALLALAGVPLLLALLIALVVALPLSMVLFRGLRGRLDGALAAATQRRSSERAALRARLRGDEPEAPCGRPESADEARREAHGGRGGPGQ